MNLLKNIDKNYAAYKKSSVLLIPKNYSVYTAVIEGMCKSQKSTENS